MMTLADDPTGLSSPIGQVLIAAGIAAAAVAALRFLWWQRKR